MHISAEVGILWLYVRLNVFHMCSVLLYLDSFAREFCGNIVLGETFFTALVNMQFASDTSKFPYIRVAALAANLVCPQDKIQDGIARLLTKTDLGALQRKERLREIQAAETLLEECWSVLAESTAAGCTDATACHAIFGKVASRVALFLTKKGKDGPEGKAFASLRELRDVFSKDVESLVKTGAPARLEAKPAPSAPAQKDLAKPVDMAEMSSPKFLAIQAGFKIGCLYTQKGASKQFNLIAMEDDNVQFSEVTLRPGEPERLTVQYEDLKKSFSLFKGQMQQRIPVDAGLWIGTHPMLAREQLKCNLWLELMKGAEPQSEVGMVEFFANPICVRAAVDIAPKKLMRMPYDSNFM